jgi:hypothetical protein
MLWLILAKINKEYLENFYNKAQTKYLNQYGTPMMEGL